MACFRKLDEFKKNVESDPSQLLHILNAGKYHTFANFFSAIQSQKYQRLVAKNLRARYFPDTPENFEDTLTEIIVQLLEQYQIKILTYITDDNALRIILLETVKIEDIHHQLQELTKSQNEMLAELYKIIERLNSDKLIAESALFVNVPSKSVHFVGREALIEKVVSQITSNDSISLSVEGLPGVGKTLLAVALVHHPSILHYFDGGVLWASLGQNPDVMGQLAGWADALKLDVSGLNNEELRSKAVKTTIRQRRFLLVIDDAWNLETANMFRCGGPNCCHLMTTRKRAIARAFSGANHVEHIPVLDNTSGYKLLELFAPEACNADPKAAQNLVEAVGALPLAIELLGGYLSTPENSSFVDLSIDTLKKLKTPTKRLQLATKRLEISGNQKISLQETIDLSLDELPKKIQEAFFALGAFASKPERFTLNAAQIVTKADAKTLALLIASNLLQQVGSESLTIHQVLADAARTQMPSEFQNRHREYYLNLMKYSENKWGDVESIFGQYIHARNSVRNDFRELIMILNADTFLERRGRWYERLQWAKDAVRLAEMLQLPLYMGKSLHMLGNAHYFLEDLHDASTNYERALQISHEQGDKITEANTLLGMGLINSEYHHDEENAFKYYKRAKNVIQSSKELEAEELEVLSTIYHNTGASYRQIGEFQEALKYLNEALSIRRIEGLRSVEAYTLSSLGVTHTYLGEHQVALDCYQQALQISKQVGQIDLKCRILHNMGKAYAHLERIEDAEDNYKQSLEISRHIGNSLVEATVLHNLGNLNIELKREFILALTFYQESLGIARKIKNELLKKKNIFRMAEVYIELREYDNAREFLQEVIELDQTNDFPQAATLIKELEQFRNCK
ncbi:MAG: tetratricopeptide repeat protein [Caldilineaceae bacterium]